MATAGARSHARARRADRAQKRGTRTSWQREQQSRPAVLRQPSATSRPANLRSTWRCPGPLLLETLLYGTSIYVHIRHSSIEDNLSSSPENNERSFLGILSGRTREHLTRYDYTTVPGMWRLRSCENSGFALFSKVGSRIFAIYIYEYPYNLASCEGSRCLQDKSTAVQARFDGQHSTVLYLRLTNHHRIALFFA